MLTTKLKSFGTFMIAKTSSSIALCLTGIDLIVIPIATGIACGLTISNKVIYETIRQKYNKYKKQYQKDQQTIISFDKLNRRSLQDNLIDNNEYDSLWKIFTRCLDGTENESFFIKVHEKLNFLIIQKIQPRTVQFSPVQFSSV